VAILVRNLPARLRQDERPEPQDPAEWLRTHGVTVAALTVITIQLVWMAVLLAHSYFIQDDFRAMDRAQAHGLSWSNLMLVDAGHLVPFRIALAWVLVKISLYNWPLTALSILALLAAACLALLRMLRTLFGNRPAILIPLIVYVFSPLLLGVVTWWVVAVEMLPLEVAIFMAVDAHVRYLRSGRFRTAIAAAGWLLFGMAAADKAAAIPLLLFALTSAFFVEGRWAVAAVRAARQYWRAWLLYLALFAVYCVVFVIQLRGNPVQPASPGPVSNVVGFISTMIGTTLVPAALGGPWRWLPIGQIAAGPPVALQQLSWVVAGLVVLVSCLYRTRAWRVWAIFAGWVAVADVVPVVIGRLGNSLPMLPGSVFGLEPRYVADAAAVLALCLGLAFLPLVGEQRVYRFQLAATAPQGAATGTGRTITRSAHAAIALVVAAFLVGSFWSFQMGEATVHTLAARSYIATARAAVAQAPRDTVILDTPAPLMIMNPFFLNPENHTSYVIGAMAREVPAKHLSWVQSPHGVVSGLMVFDSHGQLRPAVVAGVSSGPPPAGRRCWSVTSAGTPVPLHVSLFRWAWIVRLDYSGPTATLALRLSGNSAVVALPAGAHAMYVPLAGKGNNVTISLMSPWPGGCLTGVTVGTWQPAQSGPAIPAAPVPG
jgi:hypothetical protein